jgi:hypothetical protein
MGKFRLNREQFNKWIKALNSGRYKQTTGQLQDEHGYCCLGVACKVLIPKKKLVFAEEGEFNDEGEEIFKNTGLLEGYEPKEQQYAPKWLVDINKDFENKYRDEDGHLKSLINLNDDEGYSFKQIAEALQFTYPERKKAKISTKKLVKKKK